MKLGIYLFDNDLRTRDNPGLNWLNQEADQLVLVYCLDPTLFRPGKFGIAPMSHHRWHFLKQSLEQLQVKLASYGQQLTVKFTSHYEGIRGLIEQFSPDLIVRNRSFGYSENQQWQKLIRDHPSVSFRQCDGFTLLTREQVQYQEFPHSFSQFKKQFGDLFIASPICEPELKSGPRPRSDLLPESESSLSIDYKGGEYSAFEHIKSYFSGTAPHSYKQTRNQLQGNNSSTRLSPWLANGSLSARQALTCVEQYEELRGANEGTQWIRYELLWREYFQWFSRHHGTRLFRFTGINGKRPLTSFYPQRFVSWCLGETQYPLVNACMKELNHTGFLSNRGRQIAASCLVNELSLDWRAGAAYFESRLIDYDVASNWGNWQYIAGVGSDPRGGRHFNLEKQTLEYDADGAYRKRWHAKSVTHAQPNIADWPEIE